LDTFIFQIHSYLKDQGGVCGIISQRELNEIWVWWSNILNAFFVFDDNNLLFYYCYVVIL